MKFIPETPEHKPLEVPYFEDSQEKKVAGYSLKLNLEDYQENVRSLLMKLGATSISFVFGKFEGVKMNRYGYSITFEVRGVKGRIDCAALPIRAETPTKKRDALKQCTYLVQTWLEGEINSLVYRPGAITLLPYLIGAGGKTVTESLMESQTLPDFTGYALLLPVGRGQSDANG